ncbi:hypothetical protein AB0L49_49250, partial [Streptomyces antimycoticus]
RLTDQEGQKLQQIVCRGSTSSVRYRRAMMLLAPSDVLAGWLLGAALVYGAIASYGYVQSRTSEREASPEGRVRS